MCTVSYIKTDEGVIITSNRDEKVIRQKALNPQEYIINNRVITFPKDPQAGGTWIAHTDQSCVVLLNGAEIKHQSNPPYRESRGKIVLELVSGNPVNDWEIINLENIEPFTLITYQNNQLFQFRWNGLCKETIELNANDAHIWSSSTLYSQKIKDKREAWFSDFLSKNKDINSEKMLNFHLFTENSNTENGLQINRNNTYKTVSITQIVKNTSTKMNHIDLM